MPFLVVLCVCLTRSESTKIFTQENKLIDRPTPHITMLAIINNDSGHEVRITPLVRIEISIFFICQKSWVTFFCPTFHCLNPGTLHLETKILGTHCSDFPIDTLEQKPITNLANLDEILWEDV